MTASVEKPRPCYRDPNNGVHFARDAHRHDCDEHDCRGCVVCNEAHCTARTSCTWHLATGELTCGRCIAGVRNDLRWVEILAALLLPQALTDGVDSEAANLAGPAADPEAWSWRKVAARQGRAWHVSLVEDDDEHHPRRVVGTWALMLAEDYGHDMPHAATLAWCVGYLDRTLHRVAHDDGQDFPLLRREVRKCRQHLEAVLHNDDRPDRGIPCPECVAHQQAVRDDLVARNVPKDEWPKVRVPRLQRVYAHWCEAEDCRKEHFDHEAEDVWRCPRDRSHEWTHRAYSDRLTERKVKTA